MTTRTVRASQGSQPTFEGVRVGIVVAATHQGEPKVRLLIRSWEEKKRVDLVVGDSEDLFGRGTLTVDGIHLSEDARTRDQITLTFDPSGGAAHE